MSLLRHQSPVHLMSLHTCGRGSHVIAVDISSDHVWRDFHLD